MDKVRSVLRKALGEKGAEDFINLALTTYSSQDVKIKLCALIDTTQAENRKVLKTLMMEKEKRESFPTNGYRKTDTNPNAPCVLMTDSKQSGEAAKTTEPSAPESKKKPKAKFCPLFKEGARGDQLVSKLPGRHPCQCLATKHTLINNCSSCGRIVCDQEGSGPCYFCGNLVCTIAENLEIAKGTKAGVKLRNRLLNVGWAAGVAQPPYRSKRFASVSKPTHQTAPEDAAAHESDDGELEIDEDGVTEFANQFVPGEGAQQRMEEGLAAAIANRDRLLDYDATSARRTRVLDDEMDYFVTEGSGTAAVWLSRDARQRVAQRVAELRAQRHASQLEGTQLCLDLNDHSVKVLDNREDAAQQLYNPDLDEIEELVKPVPPTSTTNNINGEVTTADIDRMIDPTLNPQLLKFVPQSIESSGTSDRVPLSSLNKALRQPFAELRLQDECSRQLQDEGYCLSLHQPWASLLVRGIKRDEGRDWYSAHRGCLWIASTSKKPDPDDIREAEQAFLSSGGDRINLPPSYPTGCLLGRVNVVDVLSQEEYRKQNPNGSSLSPFVFLCDDPRELIMKLPISGKHKIYKLEPHVHLAAKKHLS